MASNTENVKLGVCNVYFDGQDLGFTKGGVEVEVQTNTHEVTVDQLGETPIDEIIMSRTISVTVPLAETTLQNLVKIMPGSALVAEGAVYATGTVTFSVSPPINNDSVNIDGTTFTFKTAPDGPNDLAIPGTFTAAATALANAINGNVIAASKVVATANAGVVTLTARDYGTAPNAFTLVKTATNIAVSGATLTGGINATRAKVVVSSGVSTSLLALAKELVLRPIGTTGEDDLTVYRAMTGGALNYSYSFDNERVFNTVFKGYADANGRMFSVGNNNAA